jgi:hypothetical protein
LSAEKIKRRIKMKKKSEARANRSVKKAVPRSLKAESRKARRPHLPSSARIIRLAALVFIILVAAAGISFFLLRNVFVEQKSMTVEDVCGIAPTGRFFQNSVPDDEHCRIRCQSACISRDYRLKSHSFAAGTNGSCNTCLCSCVRSLI